MKLIEAVNANLAAQEMSQQRLPTTSRWPW